MKPVMSDPVGDRLQRWIGTIATAAMAATAIVFTPLTAAAAATAIAEFPTVSGSVPEGITVGAGGNLWFTEGGGDMIGQSTPDGAIKEFTGLSGSPWWIVSGPGGNLWVTEPSQSLIGELSSTGVFMSEFPTPTLGSAPNQIALGPDGNIWFTEYNADKIGMINLTSTPPDAITEFPISTGAGPTAIVAGPDGNLWFTEQKSNRIGSMTTSGAPALESGPVGSTPGGIAVGPDGNVWFTEYYGNQIGRITMQGAVKEYAVTTVDSRPASIAAGRDGNLWFTEGAGNQIGQMSTAGVMLGEFAIATGSSPNGITAGPDGTLWFTEPNTNHIGRLTPGSAAADPTALTYDGATTGDFNDPATVSATLADTSTTPATPLKGQSVVFTLSPAETCTGATDDQGHASCALTPAEASGAYSVAASFAGTATLNASSTSASFAVTVEETALTLTAPAVIANGSSVSLSAVLTEDGKTPIPGDTVTLGLGTGDAAQTCSAITSATGAATCTISVVSQPLGASGLSATFAGDGFYAPASAGGASVMFAFVSGGMFVVGDGSAHMRGAVTFWSSKWADSNTLSGRSGPSSFKGFATTMTPGATCGGTWTSTPGDSSNPPAGPLPAYMAVVVASSVDKSGSTITGNIARIVIVQTDPSGDGTGTVVAVLCSA
jgi:streptogramin lyase